MDIDFASPQEVRAFQNTKLQDALAYLQARSPYYQRLFATHHIDIARIKDIDDLRVIPFTGKQELQQNNHDFLCVPPTEIRDYVTTSGTLGDPVTVALTHGDLDRLAYNEQRAFSIGGAQKGDVFQLMTTIDKRFMAGLAYFLGIRQLGGGIVRVGNGVPALQWDTIARIKPNALICVPSFLLRLVEYARANGIDYKNSSVKKAYCIGECLRNQDFSLSLLGQRIKEQWDIELYTTYASTEMATSFCECAAGKGGHLIPELIICEFVDDNGQAVKEGEDGELVITTLGVEGMPLLRFRTGDIVRYHTAPCACGRRTLRVGPLVGRKNHMIKLKGTTLYPPAINDVLDHFPFIDNYVVVLSTNNYGTDHVRVDISLAPHCTLPVEQAVGQLREQFRSRLRVAPEIRVVPANELRQVTHRESMRKVVKLIDNR